MSTVPSEVRIGKYVSKLERPKEGEVYHTKLKHCLRTTRKHYMVVTLCQYMLDMNVRIWYRNRGLRNVDRAKAVKLARRVYKRREGYDDVMRRCLRWFRDSPDLCVELVPLIFEILAKCGLMYCDVGVRILDAVDLTLRAIVVDGELGNVTRIR